MTQIPDPQAAANNGHARRIVAAVFELPQAFNQHRHDIFWSDVSDNSTHGESL
jgi:hypothetical protein